MGFNREPGGTLNSMTTGGKSYYYLTDALGSVVALTDDTGAKVNSYSYSPRGVTRAATTEQVPQPYRFAGGYQDPTGLYHYEARYYDPNIGRFTSPDPSGQEKNPYLYAEGDPVNRIDPTGLLSLSDVGDFLESTNDIWGAVTGCIAGIGAAAETGIIAAASTFGPWGTAAAVGVGCVVGGAAGYANAELITYG
jgi:RHS repeat-associated protein